MSDVVWAAVWASVKAGMSGGAWVIYPIPGRFIYGRGGVFWVMVTKSGANLVTGEKKWSSHWSSQTVLFDAFSCILEAIDTPGKGDCETLESLYYKGSGGLFS